MSDLTPGPHRILFATVPVEGHVHPLLPIAAELTGRGHRVTWLTGRRFRGPVEATGASFEPLASAHDPGDGGLVDRFPERARLSGLARLTYDLKHVFIDEIPRQSADLERVAAGVDAQALVADLGFVGAAAHHQRTGLPWATVGITLLVLPSRDLPPFGPGLPPLRGPLDRLRATGILLAQRAMMRDVDRHHNRVRASLGLPPTSDGFFTANLSTQLLLQSGTPALDYPRPDLPRYVHHVGLLFSAGRSSRQPEDWSGLAGDRPLLLVTQGTVADQSEELVLPTLRALADEPVFVVAVARDGVAAEDVPANARVLPFVPYDEVLPQAAAMITNGGYGGVQAALAHGVPLAVAGTSEDKPEVAARVAWSGAGINLRTATPSEDQLRRAVRRLLGEPGFRAGARRLQADLARHNGPVESADLIERLARTREPVLRSDPVGTPTSRPVAR